MIRTGPSDGTLVAETEGRDQPSDLLPDWLDAVTT